MSAREVRAPRGPELSCRSWPQEAALRMLMNNLDPDVAERPEDLVVYGGTGRAARSWEAYDAIVATLRGLADDETLLVQSGKPVAVFRTHEMAPRVLISNSMLVPKWADWDTFRELEQAGLTMYGQMTAGSWIYIGTQGILQGTYETFAEAASQRFGGTLAGTITLTGGLGGMGGAQPLAVTMNDGVALCVDVDPSRIERRVKTRYIDREEQGHHERRPTARLEASVRTPDAQICERRITRVNARFEQTPIQQKDRHDERNEREHVEIAHGAQRQTGGGEHEHGEEQREHDRPLGDLPSHPRAAGAVNDLADDLALGRDGDLQHDARTIEEADANEAVVDRRDPLAREPGAGQVLADRGVVERDAHGAVIRQPSV